MRSLVLSVCLVGLLFGRQAHGQCPWHQEVPDLQASCLCAYNLGQELSVQCDQVSFNGNECEHIARGWHELSFDLRNLLISGTFQKVRNFFRRTLFKKKLNQDSKFSG